MEDDDEKKAYASPTSSPPTPPSPLPISVGPGNQRYIFSPSPSPSPPFSQPPSGHASAENLPLLPHGQKLPSSPPAPSPFSLDYRRPPEDSDSKSSCLVDLIMAMQFKLLYADDLGWGDFDWLAWFIERCCNCGAKSR